MICQFCKCEIPDTQPFNFCPTCGQTIPSPQDRPTLEPLNVPHRF